MRHLGPRHWTWQARAILLSAIWGTSFLFMKEGDRSFVPYEVTSGRVAVGALTLVVVLVASRQPLPRGLRLWGHLAVAGLLMNAVPFT
ncbi:MAG: EamA family transporter, partial [Acidimicrobiales bacterium]